MSRIYEHNSQNEQLVGYFSSYIADLYSVVGEVKSMVYSLVNMHGIKNKKYEIPQDIHSIMSTCKRTFDDMKRIEAIMKGLIKGKDGQSDNRHSISKKSKINLNNFQQSESEKQTPRSNKIYKEGNDKNYSLIKLTELKQSPVVQIQKYKSIQKQNNKTDDIQLSIQNYNDLQKIVDQTTTTTIPNDQNIFRKDYEMKISRIRQRRQKETQSMNSNTRQCLNLIKSIKKQLELNKNKSRKKF